jgi:hypothetical protein
MFSASIWFAAFALEIANNIDFSKQHLNVQPNNTSQQNQHEPTPEDNPQENRRALH